MKNNTTIKVPKKYQRMIDEIDKDMDGYWVYTRKGYYSPDTGTHTIHEYTQHETLKMVRNLQPCDCEKCLL